MNNSCPKMLKVLSCCTRNKLSQSCIRFHVTDRQKELMARSLPKRKQLPGVQHVIIVASGKGGVGKTTASVNLAVALAMRGLKIGLLDGDIFGPSVPLMMNLNEEPLVDDNNLMIPPVNFGVKCNSMGLLERTKPAIWRGPLVMSALQRLLLGTSWQPCDILIVDTPPGTGDVHLSLTQHVHISGVLLVSTPQMAALDITARGAEMFRTLKVPIMGLAENMSHVKCNSCSNSISLFDNKTESMSKKMDVEVLQSIPMDQRISNSSDIGKPILLSDPESDLAGAYKKLAEKTIQFLKLNELH